MLSFMSIGKFPRCHPLLVLGTYLMLGQVSPASGQATSSGSPVVVGAGAIKGSVVDELGAPLGAVEVTILRSGKSIRTDAAGLFEFRDLPIGTYQLEARRLGYQPQARDVTVASGSDVRVAIVLRATAQQLEAKKVTARAGVMPPGAPDRMFDFYRRRATGVGTFITRDDIERAGSVRASLGGIAGVRVGVANGGQVRDLQFIRCSGTIGGRSPVAYFVDGFQTGGGFAFLSDADIEAMEIYKGPASMPAEAVGNACAAVFIWTRR